MHTHILIPTDGSDLSDEAIQYGTALAKAVDAKVTGVTVSSPFHFFAVEPDMVADTLESCTQSQHQIECIDSKGATHVHLKLTADEHIRKSQERDLLAAYPQAYAPTGCNQQGEG